MPIVDVSLAAGRTREQLRDLIAALHNAVEQSIGASPNNITVIVREVERDHWSRANTTIAEHDSVESAATTS